MKYLRKLCTVTCLLLSVVLLLTAVTVGAADHLIPERIVRMEGEEIPLPFCYRLEISERAVGTFGGSEEGVLSLFGLLPLGEREVVTYRPCRLLLGGEVFGIRFPLSGLLVTELADPSPAKEGGLLVGDLLLSVNGEPLSGSETLFRALESSEGAPVTLTLLRGGEEVSVRLSPQRTEEGYRLGVYLKESASGIGTVTFIDPESGAFGGLGHGVYRESGTLLPVSRGSVYRVSLCGVIEGRSGDPGALEGRLSQEKIGTLLSNTDSGVFGVLAEGGAAESLEIALSSAVKTGPATVYCTLPGKEKAGYSVEITGFRSKDGNKNFTLKITDERLLSESGGIVQGMSGSPIVQNGKLIGAVTHVMVNDPTEGYGIFIENMLAAMPSELRP